MKSVQNQELMAQIDINLIFGDAEVLVIFIKCPPTIAKLFR